MYPDATLAPEHAENSPLNGRLIFVLATPESGADLVVRALKCLPGVVGPPVPTNLFSLGFDGLLDTWLPTDVEVAGRVNGLADLVDELELMALTRELADALFEPLAGPDGERFVVEHSPDHIRFAATIAAIYPDAHLLHIVRHGGDVAARLASPDRGLYWGGPGSVGAGAGRMARSAAEQWCDDQRAAEEFSDLPAYRLGRIERILADPSAFLAWVADGMGLDVTADALQLAAGELGAGLWELTQPSVGRAHALVNAMGGDLLESYDYQPADVSTRDALLGRLQLEREHITDRSRETVLDLSERLRALSARWEAEATGGH